MKILYLTLMSLMMISLPITAHTQQDTFIDVHKMHNLSVSLDYEPDTKLAIENIKEVNNNTLPKTGTEGLIKYGLVVFFLSVIFNYFSKKRNK